MRRVLVLNVVGLTAELLPHAPHLSALAKSGGWRPVGPVLPAVTCSVQSTYLTGLPPAGHGVVGNGWYFRDLSEIWLWRQSNKLVAGEKLWETAKRRDPTFTVAKLFWWYNMYSSADMAVTPRPCYPADGRKIPDLHTQPAGLRAQLQEQLGRFPLFNFWGPTANIASSRWIAQSTLAVMNEHKPTMVLTYLPHLDYDLQRFGPNHPKSLAAVADIDALCGEMIEAARRQDMAVIALSEYGINEVSGSVGINRVLRKAGLLALREELGRELLDAGASDAFAVADHQVAHVYVKDSARIGEVAAMLKGVPGIEQVLTGGIDHSNAGEIVCVSAADKWFSYGWWLDDSRAPDFARTVDIHKKPGYDPCELFLDPAIRFPKAKIGWTLAKRKLGMRSLMDVIPLDESLVKGSHGRPPDDPNRGAMLISSEADLLPPVLPATGVRNVLLDHVFAKAAA